MQTLRLCIPRKGSAYLPAGTYTVRAGFGALLYGTTAVAIARPGVVLHVTGVECLRCVHELRLESCEAPVDVRQLYERMDFLRSPAPQRLAETAALAADWSLNDTQVGMITNLTREAVGRRRRSELETEKRNGRR